MQETNECLFRSNLELNAHRIFRPKPGLRDGFTKSSIINQSEETLNTS